MVARALTFAVLFLNMQDFFRDKLLASIVAMTHNIVTVYIFTHQAR